VQLWQVLQQVVGRTFGVQSLRELTVSFAEVSAFAEGRVGGVAVALAVSFWIIPGCLIFQQPVKG
jgi:hypothetical protein